MCNQGWEPGVWRWYFPDWPEGAGGVELIIVQGFNNYEEKAYIMRLETEANISHNDDVQLVYQEKYF